MTSEDTTVNNNDYDSYDTPGSRYRLYYNCTLNDEKLEVYSIPDYFQ